MITIIFKKNRRQSGYTILELVFYVSLFAILSVVVINSMLTMSSSFKKTTLKAELVQSGSILERITREIRGSYDFSLPSASDLILNTKDSSGVDKTVEFMLSGNDIRLLENSILIGNLNTPNIFVTALTFTQITTTQGKAVKIFLTFKSNNDASGITQDFYDTVVLRGIYK